jgi:hypothetical protein
MKLYTVIILHNFVCVALINDMKRLIVNALAHALALAAHSFPARIKQR